MAKCLFCGTMNNDGARNCAACGMPFSLMKTFRNPKPEEAIAPTRGTAPGSTAEQAPAAEAEIGDFKDPRDGRVYKTVKIGKQIWMAENLDYGEFVVSDAVEELTPGQKLYYDDDKETGRRQGGLYTWDIAKQSCPPGWHLPTVEEWEELEAHIMSKDVPEEEVGTSLKSKSGWEETEKGNGTDLMGFNALPSGLRSPDGFCGLGETCSWWADAGGEEDEWCSFDLDGEDGSLLRDDESGDDEDDETDDSEEPAENDAEGAEEEDDESEGEGEEDGEDGEEDGGEDDDNDEGAPPACSIRCVMDVQ